MVSIHKVFLSCLLVGVAIVSAVVAQEWRQESLDTVSRGGYQTSTSTYSATSSPSYSEVSIPIYSAAPTSYPPKCVYVSAYSDYYAKMTNCCYSIKS